MDSPIRVPGRWSHRHYFASPGSLNRAGMWQKLQRRAVLNSISTEASVTLAQPPRGTAVQSQSVFIQYFTLQNIYIQLSTESFRERKKGHETLVFRQYFTVQNIIYR